LHRSTPEYGKDRDGREIVAPAGWRILPKGQYVPQVHREFIHPADRHGLWAGPRRCHSTMTAIHADVWGWVHAYAVPDPDKDFSP